VLLARALFSAPEMMILDEPASGLDLPGREALLDALEAVATMPQPMTTIVATHHLEEVAPSTTHAALLRQGQIVAAGPVEGVLNHDALSTCFGIDVEIDRRRGRWSAVANRAGTGAGP
jgi:iron complex transport system ATP-binding protein